ncbi:MAG: long-chain acyl-CoA synthetase, partial [Pseudonocardiales bacterium]|nr:long-chain acyl-CoA synthetase [Pseudonocardiales bacterium]
LPQWLDKTGRPADTSLAELVTDEDLLAEIQSAIDDANRAVSTAESIRRFAVLDVDWTEQGGQLTPSMKLKRSAVQAEFADRIAEMYASG